MPSGTFFKSLNSLYINFSVIVALFLITTYMLLKVEYYENILYAFMILAFFSCKKNQENSNIEKWKLVNMTSAWTGQSQSFNYQQYIILNVANGTYKKERWENDKLTASTLGT